MTKYINTEKLKAEIERRQEVNHCMADNAINSNMRNFYDGEEDCCKQLISFIDSLQQEQQVLPGIEDPGIPGKDFIPVEWVDACEMYGKWKIVKQEQPEPTCKTCGFYENNCPFIRGKLIPYPNKVCKDYTYSVMKEQEQQDVDLEKEIDACWQNWLSPSNQKEVEGVLPKIEFAMYARHFWNKGYNARKEENK